MRLIAHRGLLYGPDPKLENHPDQIRKALGVTMDAEIDVWWVDGKWYLGHDEPTYKIDEEFIGHPDLWIHCKNVEALEHINGLGHRHNYFWHQEDDYAVTSRGFIWVYPGKPTTSSSILVLPERDPNWRETLPDYYDVRGICTDYAGELVRRYWNEPRPN